MKQVTFSDAEYALKRRQTRREKFLGTMEQLMPWAEMEALIEPVYPKAGRGRRPYPLPVMLRVHCMQLFYNLSDPAMEDALYEIDSMRRFAGLSISDRLPDESTILKFRHLLERHELGQALFGSVNEVLAARGLSLRKGTIVDATILSAPSSTKNKEKARDPEMHQTRKGQQWYFGMKMHIGVDDVHGLIHSIDTTAANVSDISQTDKLLHGEEQRVWGDAGYTGVEKRPEHQQRDVGWMIAMKRGQRQQLDEDSAEELIEQIMASTRAIVEHPFRYIKRVFGYDKVRYRGLAKNHERLHLLAAFTNLWIAKDTLLA